jgi:hypothetical protein
MRLLLFVLEASIQPAPAPAAAALSSSNPSSGKLARDGRRSVHGREALSSYLFVPNEGNTAGPAAGLLASGNMHASARHPRRRLPPRRSRGLATRSTRPARAQAAYLLEDAHALLAACPQGRPGVGRAGRECASRGRASTSSRQRSARADRAALALLAVLGAPPCRSLPGRWHRAWWAPAARAPARQRGRTACPPGRALGRPLSRRRRARQDGDPISVR